MSMPAVSSAWRIGDQLARLVCGLALEALFLVVLRLQPEVAADRDACALQRVQDIRQPPSNFTMSAPASRERARWRRPARAYRGGVGQVGDDRCPARRAARRAYDGRCRPVARPFTAIAQHVGAHAVADEDEIDPGGLPGRGRSARHRPSASRSSTGLLHVKAGAVAHVFNPRSLRRRLNAVAARSDAIGHFLFLKSLECGSDAREHSAAFGPAPQRRRARRVRRWRARRIWPGDGESRPRSTRSTSTPPSGFRALTATAGRARWAGSLMTRRMAKGRSLSFAQRAATWLSMSTAIAPEASRRPALACSVVTTDLGADGRPFEDAQAARRERAAQRLVEIAAGLPRGASVSDRKRRARDRRARGRDAGRRQCRRRLRRSDGLDRRRPAFRRAGGCRRRRRAWKCRNLRRRGLRERAP